MVFLIFSLLLATFHSFPLLEHFQQVSPLNFQFYSESFSGQLQIHTENGFESSFEFQFLNHTYYYKNNVLYELLPPFRCPIPSKTQVLVSHFINSLKLAKPLPFEEIQIPKLKDKIARANELWQLEWMGELFILTLQDDNSFSLLGKDFSIDFRPTSQPFPINNYPVANDCYSINKNAKINLNLDFLNSLLASQPETNKQSKWWKSRGLLRGSVPKRCVFMHGSGRKPNEVMPPTERFEDYWGHIEDFTPQCSKRIFLHLDTLSNGWDYIPNQKELCRVAVGNSTTNTISDTIIFTHSMGGLIFGGALMNGYCQLSNTSSSWFASGMPANGSTVVNLLETYCSNASSAIRIILDKLVLCQNKIPYPVYSSLKPNHPGLAKVHQYATQRLNGEMCGLDAYGLNSFYSSLFVVLQQLGTGLGKPNDGLVSFGSCSVKNQNLFQPNSQSKYYATSGNHADITCRNGNGIVGQQRKPCDWFTNKGA